MIRRLYDWTIALAETRYALWALAIVAFIESSVFPIPPDVLMIPMILATPRRAFLIAGIATVSSVAGGAFGYLIGAQFYDQIGRPVLEALGKGSSMEAFNTRFNDFGFWAVLVAGLLWAFGAPVRDFIERRLGLVFVAFVVLLLGGFYILRYL